MDNVYEFPRDHFFWFLVERRPEPAEIIEFDGLRKARVEREAGDVENKE